MKTHYVRSSVCLPVCLSVRKFALFNQLIFLNQIWNQIFFLFFRIRRPGSFNLTPKYTSSHYKYHWFYRSDAHGSIHAFIFQFFPVKSYPFFAWVPARTFNAHQFFAVHRHLFTIIKMQKALCCILKTSIYPVSSKFCTLTFRWDHFEHCVHVAAK